VIKARKPRLPMMQVDPDSLLNLVELHLSWYPLMELRDIYKLLYQGVMGSEHLITNGEEYTHNLRSEFAHLHPDSSQRLLEPVRLDGALFRLNLRPYKSKQLGIEVLTSYLLETAYLISGTRAELSAVWALFVKLCQQGQINLFDCKILQHFSQWLEEMEYPAIHHSEVYCHAYQPAYRLISANFISALELSDAS
jgi:hypothetical protein